MILSEICKVASLPFMSIVIAICVCPMIVIDAAYSRAYIVLIHLYSVLCFTLVPVDTRIQKRGIPANIPVVTFGENKSRVVSVESSTG